MCSYITERAALDGSAKGGDRWFRLTSASVYFDHPQHALPDHTLNIDFLNDADGDRVAVELSPEAARALVASIEAALAEGARAHLH
jgi:hypothetical protein